LHIRCLVSYAHESLLNGVNVLSELYVGKRV
jgi:hypothetical protein